MPVRKLVLEANNFKGFNEMQKPIAEKELFKGNLVVSSPTASGKTIIAELAALHSIIGNGLKVVYTCPLRALASEHFNDFKKKYARQKIRFAVSTGDMDSSSAHLANYDCIFTTYEKLDSLLRHNAAWLSGIGLLIVDEIHELDSSRGPTIEVTVAKLKHMNPKVNVLALSATIPNAKEIAEWLSAELVESNYRPIPLKEGVFFDKEICYSDSNEELPDIEGLGGIITDTLFEKKKQALVFANTRKRAEGIAQQLSNLVSGQLSAPEKNSLEKTSAKILNALESPTEQCRKLSKLVSHGVAFHHAGLLQKQRSLIEDAFRENKIKVISSTPTLAAGVNLPSHTVLIPSLYRFEATGMQLISVREYKQLAGRAGRPKYDSEGRSIVVARSESEKDELLEEYVNGKLEEIGSRLGYAPVLRMHLLALVANHYVFNLKSMEEFFSKTFYAKQFGNLHELFNKTREILQQLIEMGFVEGNENNFKATKLGARVSELYLDPVSAFSLINGLKSKKKFTEFFYLYLLSNTFEFSPWPTVQKKLEPGLWEDMGARENELPIQMDREQFFDNDLLKKFNSALMLESWVNEKPEQSLLEDFKIQPGILRAKLNISDWLAYSAFELAKLLALEQHFVPLSRMRKRLKSGIKEELVSLCEVRGIGRVRARRLWRANIRSIAALKKTDLKDLQKILGLKIGEQIKERLGGNSKRKNIVLE
ncbi:MAG: DEAD/DEAH box helicase [Candidatus Diapherotrites archaeon]|nr:DEAD/DEAH box helicase [Candidatus Diapherotrites archaeon]